MKKVLITGASRGIGKVLARSLLDEGCEVVGVARKQTIHEDQYFHYPLDLAVDREVEQTAKQIAKSHADLEAIICCAGYGQFVELEQFSYADMQRMMQVNFLSQALLIKILLSNLKRNKNSKIILLGSECALHGQKKGTLYCASKFALRGFAESLRAECQTADVAVSIVNPGMVATSFFDQLNFKPGDDKANAIGAEQVKDMIQMVLTLENNCVVHEINCQPLKKVVAKKNN